MRIIPYTNLTASEIESCKKLELLNVLITMEKGDGEIFHIITHESQRRYLSKNHPIFLPQEIFCLSHIKNDDVIEQIMRAKLFLGAKIIYSGPKITVSSEENFSVNMDMETMRQKFEELKRKKKEEKKSKKGQRGQYKF